MMYRVAPVADRLPTCQPFEADGPEDAVELYVKTQKLGSGTYFVQELSDPVEMTVTTELNVTVQS